MFLVFCICLLSVESDEKKLERVEFYSKTKNGVDEADEISRQYLVQAATCRWPVAVFYNFMDLAGVNAFVLYKKQISDKASTRDLLFQRAIEIWEKNIVERSSRNATIARPHPLLTIPKKN